MPVFQHQGRTIEYKTELAPFGHDLILLQGSRFNVDFWQPVIENLSRAASPAGGRILVCEWANAKLDIGQLARDLGQLIQTMGLQSLHVVACDDAVAVVNELQKQQPGVISETLLFSQNTLRTDDLVQDIREFSQI